MKNILKDKFGAEPLWVLWKLQTRNGKVTKIPFSINGEMASSTDPATWATYDEVSKFRASYDGIGIVFTSARTLLGLDIDHVIENGKFLTEFLNLKKFVDEAETYVELSPSKTGLHLFFEITEPLKLEANRHGQYEVYCQSRYFTVTENPFGEAKPIRKISPSEALEVLHKIGYPWRREETPLPHASPSIPALADDELLQKMFSSKIGAKIQSLYNGNISEYDNDVSRADMALCSYLSFWTAKDAARMEALWLASPLGQREKTQERKDYRDRTIAQAIQNCTETYKKIAGIEAAMPSSENSGAEINWEKQFASQDEKKGASLHVAKHIIKLFSVKTIGGEKNREIYIYEKGIYVRGESALRKWLQEALGKEGNTYAKNEVIEKIKDLSPIDRKDFSVDTKFINLNNGIFNVDKGTLMAHSPEYLFFDKIPVDYVEGVDCPVIKQFLRSILNKKDVALIQEFAGYLLWRSYLIKKAFILIGERDTGKTTLLNLLIKFIGELNTSGVSLQKLTSDKFSAANLYHKHLNAHDDLSINDVNDNGSFKMATGGGYISGEYKFGNRFDFKNFAKLVFACNQIPTAKQTDDDAYFGRWIVVRFEKEIRKKKPFLLEQMTTSQELSGFLNFALSGLGRLLKNGKFTYDKEPDEIRDEMMRSGSAIASFVAEGIAFEPDAWISKTDMYQVFKYYATQKRGMVMTKTSFGKKICKLAPYIKSGKKKVLKQVTGWRNVKITNSDLLNQVNMADIPESPTARNTITPELGREDIIDSTLFK